MIRVLFTPTRQGITAVIHDAYVPEAQSLLDTAYSCLRRELHELPYESIALDDVAGSSTGPVAGLVTGIVPYPPLQPGQIALAGRPPLRVSLGYFTAYHHAEP